MGNLQDKKVLIVDDEERNVFALGSYLETFGMKTMIARNGEDAISMLESGLEPDIVLMDMMMPVMTGLAATEFIMAHFPTPILIVSASVTSSSSGQTTRLSG